MIEDYTKKLTEYTIRRTAEVERKVEPSSEKGIARTTRALLRYLACAGWREGNGFGRSTTRRLENRKTEENSTRRAFLLMRTLRLSAAITIKDGRVEACPSAVTVRKGLMLPGPEKRTRVGTSALSFWDSSWGPEHSAGWRSFGGRRLLLPRHRVSDIAAWRERQTEKWRQEQGSTADTSAYLLREYRYGNVGGDY